ncbi:MAG: hypothetical protein PHH04_03740 [Thomasclavelia sp.]|nr:hypothetical protein [Thomasclavelia sp.]
MKNIKRIIITILVFTLFFVTGCSKNWSEEKKYMRRFQIMDSNGQRRHLTYQPRILNLILARIMKIMKKFYNVMYMKMVKLL